MNKNNDLLPVILENSFRASVEMCIESPEFMKEYRRLTGSHIGAPRMPIESMIDEVTGRDVDAYRKFFEFVSEFVWRPWISSLISDGLEQKAMCA